MTNLAAAAAARALSAPSAVAVPGLDDKFPDCPLWEGEGERGKGGALFSVAARFLHRGTILVFDRDRQIF